MSHLESLIDRVAERMTAAEPAGDLRRRVLARLDDRPASGSIWRVAAVAASAAAVVVAVGATVALERVRPLPAPIAQTSPSLVGALPVPAAADIAVPQAVVARRTPRVAVVSAAELAWLERAVPALAPIEAIDVEALGPAALGVAELEVKPLSRGTER